MNPGFEIPIVLIIYNRPHLVSKVFSIIREVTPLSLFLIADAPKDNDNDFEKCEMARKMVEKVDWKATVYKDYAKTHLGCKNRVISGLTWVFSIVQEAIIFEDDCVPDLTFFRFTSELLERYKDSPKVALISGNNYQPAMRFQTNESYYFSRYVHIHGWATWKRTWNNYDGEMKTWPRRKDVGWLDNYLGNTNSANYWEDIFDQVHFNRIDTWDYQLLFNVWANNQLCVMPSVNLVTNIGYGEDGTHTKNPNSRWANLPTFPIEFPLSHPKTINRNQQADYEDELRVFRLYKRG
jgi:hypothetical protein